MGQATNLDQLKKFAARAKADAAAQAEAAVAAIEVPSKLSELTNDSGYQTAEQTDAAISAAIDALIGGAPETYDTLKEIADYIEAHQSTADALTAAVSGKVDKVTGKGLSTEDFTTALKQKLETLSGVTAADVSNWNAKASTDVATPSTDGLMSKTDKAKLDEMSFASDAEVDAMLDEIFGVEK